MKGRNVIKKRLQHLLKIYATLHGKISRLLDILPGTLLKSAIGGKLKRAVPSLLSKNEPS